jgi:hypothetical protein
MRDSCRSSEPLLSALDLDGLVWRCGIQPSDFLASKSKENVSVAGRSLAPASEIVSPQLFYILVRGVIAPVECQHLSKEPNGYIGGIDLIPHAVIVFAALPDSKRVAPFSRPRNIYRWQPIGFERQGLQVEALAAGQL